MKGEEGTLPKEENYHVMFLEVLTKPLVKDKL